MRTSAKAASLAAVRGSKGASGFMSSWASGRSGPSPPPTEGMYSHFVRRRAMSLSRDPPHKKTNSQFAKCTRRCLLVCALFQ